MIFMVCVNDFPYITEPMRWGDVSQVMSIEFASFPLPWPEHAYRYELFQNEHSHYIVLRPGPDIFGNSFWQSVRRLWRRQNRRAPILAYGGFWMMVDEAHISTLAVVPAWRHWGLGELILWSMLWQARQMEALEATLEVRISNHVAQNLYRKYGFETVGRRVRYYRDNGEDAWIMTIKEFSSEACLACLQQLGQALKQRMWRDVKDQRLPQKFPGA